MLHLPYEVNTKIFIYRTPEQLDCSNFVRISKGSISIFLLKMGDQALGEWQTPYEIIIKICISRKL